MSTQDIYRLRKCFLILLLAGISSCKKFVQIPPPVSTITAGSVYINNNTASAAMAGVYEELSRSSITGGNNGICFLEGLESDELQYYFTDITATQFYKNALKSANGGVSNVYYWGEIYNKIHLANVVMEGVAGSSGLTASRKQELDGEAKFIRALLHFYATNLYGDVPLVTTANYLSNNSIKRTPQSQVYLQIIQDLIDAEKELSESYVDAYGNSTIEKTRPNKASAAALLARAYLYLGDLTQNADDYQNAVKQANFVITGSVNYQLNNNLTEVFKANSSEAIWQLAPVNPGYNTNDAPVFVLTSAPGSANFPVALSNSLISVFEPNDKRFSEWVGIFTSGGTTYYYPFKYKVYQQNQPITEYIMMLRLGEQYLIRAEAEAHISTQLNQAVADLNVIRSRAGLPPTTATTQTEVLAAILHERQVELFTEWGHRWFDLKRTGNLNSVMGAPGNECLKKGGVWSPNSALVPLPLSEIQLNPNLTQNPGY